MKIKNTLIALAEITLLYGVIRLISQLLRASGIYEIELRVLGWDYIGMLIFAGIPALYLLLKRQKLAQYGLTAPFWQVDLEIGIKAYLIRMIPIACLLGAMVLQWGYTTVRGGLFIAAGEIIAILVLLRVLPRIKPEKALLGQRVNLLTILALLLFPLVVAIALVRFTLVIVSTVIWQFLFSGFGEELVWRGYVQSRLNQVFHKPWQIAGIQFGPGLIITSLLFGFFHAFNTYDPAAGRAELAWGWALFTTFSGLMFGLLREKTGSLLAPGLAHGLPDAVGEALGKLWGWL
jgi:hypothetical protein